MIALLDPNTIAPAPHQHRQDFSHVVSLARSILQNGQQTPIQVYLAPTPQQFKMLNFIQAEQKNGRLQATTTITKTGTATHILIAGESRVRACMIAGIKVKAVIEEQPSDLDQAIGTLTENLNRKQPNPTEEAQAYKQVYDILKKQGIKEDDLITAVAKHTGKSERIISDRLIILELIPSFRHLIDIGSQSGGGINKTHAIMIAREIPKDYQYQLYKWYEVNGRYCTTEEIEAQINHVKQLYYDSLQSSIFSFSQPDTATTPPLFDIKSTRPKINGRTKPPQTLDPHHLLETIKEWNKAIAIWGQLGHDRTVRTLTAKVEVMRGMLTAVIRHPYNMTGKILDMLNLKGESTTGKIMSFCHGRKEEITKALIMLEDFDMITKRKSGRGSRYNLIIG